MCNIYSNDLLFIMQKRIKFKQILNKNKIYNLSPYFFNIFFKLKRILKKSKL